MANGSEDALRALYHETWAEIARLRDYEWKITYYFVTLAAALIVLILNDNAQLLLRGAMLCVMTGAMLGALFLGLFHLGVTHHYLTQQRNIRRQLEELLRFYDPGVYGEAAVLPPAWKGVRITSSFQRVGLVFPMMVTIVVAYGLGIYLLWARAY